MCSINHQAAVREARLIGNRPWATRYVIRLRVKVEANELAKGLEAVQRAPDRRRLITADGRKPPSQPVIEMLSVYDSSTPSCGCDSSVSAMITVTHGKVSVVCASSSLVTWLKMSSR